MPGVWRQTLRELPRSLKLTAAVLGAVALIALMLVVLRGNPFLGFSRGLTAPAPVAVEDSLRVPELPPSTLNVPVTYDLTPVVEALEGVVPRRFGSLDERHDVESNDRLSVAFALRRTPFTVELDGSRARVSTLIHYQGRGWYDPPLLPEIRASCGTDEGEPQPRLAVSLAADLRLDEAWTLRGRPVVEGIGPPTDEDRDKCRITAFNVDVTGRVVGAAERLLTDHAPRVEEALAGIDLRSRFEGWWSLLHDPISLGDDIWLVIDPVAVSRGPSRGVGSTLVASVGLRARPRIQIGERPQVTASPLPALDSADVSEGLLIRATGSAEYRAISRQLNEHLSGRELERDGRTLKVRRLRVYGIGGGRLSLEMTFEGSARGRIFLVGTPAYDPVTEHVHVPDLDFDVATSSLLVSGYTWLSRQGIVELLREQARWPIADLNSLAIEQLRRGLNRRLSDDVRIRGDVESVDVLGVYAMRDELVVHAQARATGELIVEERISEPDPAEPAR